MHKNWEAVEIRFHRDKPLLMKLVPESLRTHDQECFWTARDVICSRCLRETWHPRDHGHERHMFISEFRKAMRSVAERRRILLDA